MSTFSYIARDQAGGRVTGTLTATSRQGVLAELEARQLAPIKVDEVRDRVSGRRLPVRLLAQAYRQLSDLLRAGVPLLRALRLLGRSKANPRLAIVMARIADQVADGDRLADAMSQQVGVFPSVQIAMVRAGERGGFLEQVLARLGAFLEHQAEMRAKVIGNLIYPFVLLIIGLAIIVTALVVFVPKFKQFYARIEIPWPTQLLLATSDLIVHRWFILVVAIALVGAGAWWLRRQPEFRRWWIRLLMRVPKLGPLVRSLAVARFSRILGTLLENGIPMLSAMQISREAAGNVLLEEAIEAATERVRSGESLADPLQASGLFPEDVIEMISVGESANNLASVLVTIAETVEKRVDRMLGIFLRLMEPALLLVLAAAVLFIFVALIVPMLSMSSAI